MPTYPCHVTRGQRGRALARLELTLAAIVGFVLTPFHYVAAPAWMGSMAPEWETAAIGGGAAVSVLVGFIWMVRIYRTHPEPDQHLWRCCGRG